MPQYRLKYKNGHNFYSQLPLFASNTISTTQFEKKFERSGTFGDNMRLPVHRWFRYSAGYSANWVETLIKDKKQFVSNLAVLDPFAGIGTTLVASNVQKIRSFGFEAHPSFIRSLGQN